MRARGNPLPEGESQIVVATQTLPISRMLPTEPERVFDGRPYAAFAVRVSYGA
jgi:hypothetical protein